MGQKLVTRAAIYRWLKKMMAQFNEKHHKYWLKIDVYMGAKQPISSKYTYFCIYASHTQLTERRGRILKGTSHMSTDPYQCCTTKIQINMGVEKTIDTV